MVLTGAERAFSAGGDAYWFKTVFDDPGVWQLVHWEAKRIIT